MIRAPARQVRIKAIAHHRNRIAFSFEYRKLRHHRLRLGQLIFSSIWHKYGARSDRAVKHLDQSLLRAAVQICQCLQPFFADICNLSSCKIFVCLRWHLHLDGRLLMRAVRVKEGSGNVYDLLVPPDQHQTRLLCDNRHLDSFQILLIRIGKEGLNILRIDNDCHTLLRLGNSKLRAIQSCIFLRYLIQINLKTRCQLADRYRYAACSEVVALLDEMADLRPTEQTLQLPLGRCISFLYLCAAHLDRGLRVYLGGTGRSANTITSGPAAEQDDDIARIRIFPDHGRARSCCHDCTDLHTLRHIVRMINLLYIAGRKANLIAIGAVAVCCLTHQLFLRKLAL